MELETKYGMVVEEESIQSFLRSMKNKIYKLLPLREENLEWNKYLDTILIELSGFNELFENKLELLCILSKLQSLYNLEDFKLYRKTIFECLNEIDDLR